jgi:hypothetical protein
MHAHHPAAHLTPEPAPEAQPIRFQCRHILPAGRRCQAPCLRGEQLCYHHHTTRRPIPHPARRRARAGTFVLPPLEDRAGIQHAIAVVLTRLAAGSLDPKRAGLLLYGLQIASLNLPKDGTQNGTHASNQTSQHSSSPDSPISEPAAFVEEITHHPTLGILAPPTPIPLTAAKSFAELLLEEFGDLTHSNPPPNPDSNPDPEPDPDDVWPPGYLAPLAHENSQTAANPAPITLPHLRAAASPACRVHPPHRCLVLESRVRGLQPAAIAAKSDFES